MIRGTTPTHTFEVDFDTSLIKEVKITYSQFEKVLVEKYTQDCVITEGKIETKLTQEETFLFDSTRYVYAQIRILTNDGECHSTNLIKIEVEKCFDDEVLV